MKMIVLIFILAGLGQSAFGQVFECAVTDQSKRYEDVFLIKLSTEKNKSQVYYKRKHLASSENSYGPYEIVRGCYRANIVDDHRENYISLECENDGEEGIFDINTKTLTGEAYFYMPKIGYPERISLQYNCQAL